MAIGSQLAVLWKEVLSQPAPLNVSELWKEHLRVRAEFESLKLVNIKPSSADPKDRIPYLPAFFEWCQHRGIRHPDLEISNSEHGLGLSATNSLEDGQVVATVPLSAVFSTDIAQNSLKKLLEEDELLRSMDNVALAFSVAHEVLRGQESKWAPYFDVLPANFQTPIFYTENQLQALKPSPIFEEALGMYRAVARQFVYFYLRILNDVGEKSKKRLVGVDRPFAGSPFGPHNFTFDFYRWCVSVVSTRINLVPSRSRDRDGTPMKMIPALIPLVDMANQAHSHANPASVYFEVEANAVKVQLHKSVKANDEVHIHYGPRTNSKFLLHNGFVPQPPNPDDAYELKIGLPRSVPNFDAKLRLLITQSIFPITKQSQQNLVYLFTLKPEPLVDTLKESPLWMFAKVFVATDNLEESNSIEATENQQKAQKFLSDRFRLLIRGYATNQSEQTDEFSMNVRRLKEAEMELLNAHLGCVEKILL